MQVTTWVLGEAPAHLAGLPRWSLEGNCTSPTLVTSEVTGQELLCTAVQVMLPAHAVGDFS